jgi:hypothetical protein
VRYRSEPRFAGIAQLVEQLICNQQVIGSSPIAGSLNDNDLRLKADIWRDVVAFMSPLLRQDLYVSMSLGHCVSVCYAGAENSQERALNLTLRDVASIVPFRLTAR